jgi:ribosomal protein L37AE/L43A
MAARQRGRPKDQQACPVCGLEALVKGDEGQYLCLSCGWLRVGDQELPSEPDMDPWDGDDR